MEPVTVKTVDLQGKVPSLDTNIGKIDFLRAEYWSDHFAVICYSVNGDYQDTNRLRMDIDKQVLLDSVAGLEETSQVLYGKTPIVMTIWNLVADVMREEQEDKIWAKVERRRQERGQQPPRAQNG